MATRHIDIAGSLGNEPTRPQKPRNTITRHSLEPATRSPASTSDPSPFSRHEATEDGASRHERIARAAYERAAERGFEPGHELEDWLAAEREIDERTAHR